jgi:hypothetical protein
MPGDSSGPLHLPDWQALTPAQRNARAWRIARQAHAARARAIGEALRSAAGRMPGRLISIFASAVASAATQR